MGIPPLIPPKEEMIIEPYVALGSYREGDVYLICSDGLTGMVEELLDFSRMEDGRFTLSMEQVDLQAEFEDAVYTYRELFKQENIELIASENFVSDNVLAAIKIN